MTHRNSDRKVKKLIGARGITKHSSGQNQDILWAGNDILAVQLEANLASVKKKSL